MSDITEIKREVHVEECINPIKINCEIEIHDEEPESTVQVIKIYRGSEGIYLNHDHMLVDEKLDDFVDLRLVNSCKTINSFEYNLSTAYGIKKFIEQLKKDEEGKLIQIVNNIRIYGKMGHLIDEGTNTKISMGKEKTIIKDGESDTKTENIDEKRMKNKDHSNMIFEEEKTKNDKGNEINETIVLSEQKESITNKVAVAKKEIIDFEKREIDEMMTRRKQDQMEKDRRAKLNEQEEDRLMKLNDEKKKKEKR